MTKNISDNILTNSKVVLGKNLKNKGMGLVEIIIGSAIILSGILVANISYTAYVQYALSNQKNVQATYLLEEGLEVMSLIRDKGWKNNIATLSPAKTYYLTFNGGVWVITLVSQYVDGQFLRRINVANVNRDSNDRISTVGTLDQNTKYITVTVAYFQGHATTTRSLSTYITNIRND